MVRFDINAIGSRSVGALLMVIELLTNSSAIGAFTIGLGLSTVGSLAAGTLLIIFGLIAFGVGMQIPWEIIFATLYPLLVVAAMLVGGTPLLILGLVLIYFSVLSARYYHFLLS
jgi:hypothetical protein